MQQMQTADPTDQHTRIPAAEPELCIAVPVWHKMERVQTTMSCVCLTACSQTPTQKPQAAWDQGLLLQALHHR
jgi:hypothetical protein